MHKEVRARLLDEHDGYVEGPKRTSEFQFLIGKMNYACMHCLFNIAHSIIVFLMPSCRSIFTGRQAGHNSSLQ